MAMARHALVTGGGSGIGAAVAQALADRGLQVTVLGRRAGPLQDFVDVAPRRRHAVVADIGDAAQVARAVADAQARFGPVGVLVNNAGQVETAPFLKSDAALWQRMLDVNLGGTVACSQAVLPGMLEARWGRIVNVASTAAQVGYAYVSAYCAAKHAVLGLTRALALELATKGVTVNAVCPGYTDTDIVRSGIAQVVAKTGRSADEARAAFVRSNPQGRLVQPAEVADAVTWLCGDAAGAVTGQAVTVAGGEVM